jgi:hypothetical protein
MPDDREPYGRLFHEQGRLTVNAELPERQRRGIGSWEERDPMQQEIDMRGANAVAVQAVHDAGFNQAELAAQVIRLQVRYDAAVHEVTGRIARECERQAGKLPPSDEQRAWFRAAAVALAARETTGTEPG